MYWRYNLAKEERTRTIRSRKGGAREPVIHQCSRAAGKGDCGVCDDDDKDGYAGEGGGAGADDGGVFLGGSVGEEMQEG